MQSKTLLPRYFDIFLESLITEENLLRVVPSLVEERLRTLRIEVIERNYTIDFPSKDKRFSNILILRFWNVGKIVGNVKI